MILWRSFLLPLAAAFIFALCPSLLACSSGEGGSRGAESQRASIGLSGITATYNPSEAAWRDLLEAAREAGVSFLHFQMPPWEEAEIEPGVFDLSYFDAYFRIAGDYRFHYTIDIDTPLGLGAIVLPADLNFESFSDDELVRRYKGYVAAVLAKFPHPTHVILHTETATSTLGSDNAVFEDFSNLLSLTADYVRSISSAAKVGIYGNEEESTENLERMGRNMDFFGLGYIAGRGDVNHRERIERLADLAGSKPIGFYEAGVTTASRLGGSDAAQVEFVNTVFDFIEERGNQVEFISYYQVFDEERAITSQYVPILFPDWSIEMQLSQIDFLTSLGLRRSDGIPKPAWQTFMARIRE